LNSVKTNCIWLKASHLLTTSSSWFSTMYLDIFSRRHPNARLCCVFCNKNHIMNRYIIANRLTHGNRANLMTPSIHRSPAHAHLSIPSKSRRASKKKILFPFIWISLFFFYGDASISLPLACLTFVFRTFWHLEQNAYWDDVF